MACKETDKPIEPIKEPHMSDLTYYSIVGAIATASMVIVGVIVHHHITDTDQ